MKVFWEWWDGNKTLVGGVASFIAASLIGQLIIGEFNFQPDWLLGVQKVCVWIADVLVPFGLAHKVVKAVKNGSSSQS